MNQKELQKFISYLVDNYQVFAPQEEEKQITIKEIFDAKTAALTSQLSFYPWKNFFVPEKETIFRFENSELTENKIEKSSKTALLGVNILDLRAILLYNLVFSSDPYYQKQRENILIIGHGPDAKLSDGIIRKIDEKDLEQLPFDIFLYADSAKKNAEYKVFSASKKGRAVLTSANINSFKEIKFSGHKYNEFLEERMQIRRDKLKNKHNQKIWDELGKICIECGKCTVVCPTCFCFRIDDQAKLCYTPELKNELSPEENCGYRKRCWDSCYYQEFSEVAGHSTSSGQADKPKFLSTTAQKIHFWYFHKFARIPDEYNMMGCIGCGRCHTVCPVGINIEEVLKKIEKF